MKYNPKEYWEKRLENHPNLRGVGCAGLNETYNKYLYSSKVLSLDKILDKHSINIRGMSILDVGVGTGFFVDYYDKKGAGRISGIDITEVSISNLKRKYPHHNFFVADIGFPNLHLKEKFDFINAFDILYHITDDYQFENALNNISNQMRRGSYLMITDVFSRKDIAPAEHVKFRGLHKYEKNFKKNNIEILDISPIYYLMNRSFYLPVFMLNRLSPIFYFLDKNLKKGEIPNGKNIKLLFGIKHE